MTTNLRIVNVQVVSSTEIQVTFTENLTPHLVTSNVSIIANTPNVLNSQVLGISVNSATLTVTCQPLIPFAAYFIQFVSITQNPFESLNGDAKILQDGISNQYLITGPISPDNPVKDYFVKFFTGNIYNVDVDTSVVSQYINAMSTNLARCLYDIRQVQNENYLSFQVVDEQQFRGSGPYDRLYEEGAYEVMRVGLTPTNAVASMSITLTDFPNFPVTLQQQANVETLTPSSTDQVGTLNINTLILNLNNFPVTQLTSVVFTLLTANPIYTYNLQLLGYQIANSEYDQNYASSYDLLANNQIQLNTQILNDPLFDINQILNVTVQYQSKDLGRVVDATTVEVFTTMTSVREVLPPIENIFNLQHAPITDASNNIPLLGGVSFLDPNSNTGSPHPSFLMEIPFRLSAPPSGPGQYSIDYTTGTVYVFGASLSNDGTGPSPPLATYDYRFIYVSESDYVYDVDYLDFVALPLGNLINNAGTITFNYEEVLVPNVDYFADTHIESLTERIQNRLIALNTLTTLNSPITNVFQIYNETSGEIYTLERWTNNNQVYFQYNNPPRVLQEIGERATFQTVANELLFVNTISTNIHSLRIFTIFLANNTIIDGTEDGIGTSINSSLTFSNGNVFQVERWYNQGLSATININHLLNPGEYMVDYVNGIVYLGVSNIQPNNVGFANYKMDSIVPQFPHVLSVDDIYYRISPLAPKNKEFPYESFTDGSIIPSGLQSVDEDELNGNAGAPYQLYQTQVGTFFTGTFVPGVTNQVKFVRGIFEFSDLSFNTNPINFASASTSNNFNITVNSLNGQSFENVQFDGTNYFVTLDQNVPYLSPNIQFQFNVVRVSDGATLWNGSGMVVAGNPLKLILPGINSPHTGDLVSVTYIYTIAPLSRIVADYNKGDYFVDYTYLADEILVSYEYGDNVIDFSSSNAVSAGTPYYVTYRAGALRDALVKNFGTLVNLPELATLDVNFSRERYRDALTAALTSFLQGPTVAAIKNIGQIISHIEPQLIESSFQTWSLGQGLLYPQSVQTTGNFQLLPAHFGNGVLIDQSGQTITMPINSNIRFEEGTFEQWIVPQWNGLDNDATLNFNIIRDGYVIDPFRVFIGGSEYHPTINNGTFTLNKNANVTGLPNTNKDGVFIWYGPDGYVADGYDSFNRWYLEIIDGYVSTPAPVYQIKITSNGRFYDATNFGLPTPSNAVIFTGLSALNITITTDGYQIDEGVTFLSDLDHYLLDLGKSKDRSRLSIYKDVSGYMNFRVWDRSGTMYSISNNVSSWQAGQAHQVAASWKLNTRNNQDEMHLFIDGLEVPNITIDPEYLTPSSYDVVGSDDLTTTAGSNIVTSSIVFSNFDIVIGNTIFINEVGFSSTGYTINNINGQTLTLNTVMPLSLPGDGRFSVNQYSQVVTSDINVVPNITVSTIHLGVDTELPGVNALRPDYAISQDGYFNNILTIYNGIFAGDPIFINTLGLNNRNVKKQYYIWSNQMENVFMTQLPPPISLDEANITKIITPVTNIPPVLTGTFTVTDGYDTVIATISQPLSLVGKMVIFTSQPSTPYTIAAITGGTTIILTANYTGPSSGGVSASPILSTAHPSNSQNGRTIQATIAGTNSIFPVQVTLNGVNSSLVTVSETLTFTDYGTQTFAANRYISLNYVNVTAAPINPAKPALTVQLQEVYPITYSEASGLVPIVRYSYPITQGYNLYNDGYGVVTDDYNLFSGLDIGNTLLIASAAGPDGYMVAGFYTITGISADRHSLNIIPTIASFRLPLVNFTGGVYQVLDVTEYRSGLQNGFFTLEASLLPGQAYFLSSGFYEFDYSTYLSVKLDPLNGIMYLGSDMFGRGLADAILDQTILYSVMLTDTRVGEIVAANERSITKDYNSLIPITASHQTLVVLSFDNFPFTNSAPVYCNTNTDRVHFQSNWAVNDTFEQSLVILNQPVLVPNTGILDTHKQGTIEFWLSPLFDTANDPNQRYYFDAYGAVVEQTVSSSDVSVNLSSPASQILSVKLVAGDPGVDYFVGGKLEINTQNAIQEDGMSLGVSIVKTSEPILQVITVKIAGDFTSTDYFAGGSVGTDGQTIYLGKTLPISGASVIITYQPAINGNHTLNTQVIRLNRRLPFQNSQVVVNYIPAGLQGDRLSIYKDTSGYINFAINASGNNFVVRGPTRWAKNTWHRIKASYQINGGVGQDQMLLFLDGYQYSDVTFGQSYLFGSFPLRMGGITVGDGYGVIANIQFKDPINDLFIGTQYNQQFPAFTLLDNFRISDIFRPIYAPYGEPIDVNYNSNLSAAIPVTTDLYTTYLMNYDDMIVLNQNFAILTDREVGSFDFTVIIQDSFGIVESSPQVKQTLEALINTLKPANTVAFINYYEPS